MKKIIALLFIFLSLFVHGQNEQLALNYFDRGVYTVYFDVKSDEFLWDIDNEFIDGLEALGQKHGVKLQIPYYYYSK
jgi:hypothetical protein